MGYYDYDDQDSERLARMAEEAQAAVQRYEAEAYAGPAPKKRAPRTSQAERSGGRIRKAVLEFARANVGKRYRNGGLLLYVEEQVGFCAPDSPRRELAYMADEGLLSTAVVDRAQGWHQILWVK